MTVDLTAMVRLESPRYSTAARDVPPSAASIAKFGVRSRPSDAQRLKVVTERTTPTNSRPTTPAARGSRPSSPSTSAPTRTPRGFTPVSQLGAAQKHEKHVPIEKRLKERRFRNQTSEAEVTEAPNMSYKASMDDDAIKRIVRELLDKNRSIKDKQASVFKLYATFLLCRSLEETQVLAGRLCDESLLSVLVEEVIIGDVWSYISLRLLYLMSFDKRILEILVKQCGICRVLRSILNQADQTLKSAAVQMIHAISRTYYGIVELSRARMTEVILKMIFSGDLQYRQTLLAVLAELTITSQARRALTTKISTNDALLALAQDPTANAYEKHHIDFISEMIALSNAIVFDMHFRCSHGRRSIEDCEDCSKRKKNIQNSIPMVKLNKKMETFTSKYQLEKLLERHRKNTQAESTVILEGQSTGSTGSGHAEDQTTD